MKYYLYHQILIQQLILILMVQVSLLLKHFGICLLTLLIKCSLQIKISLLINQLTFEFLMFLQFQIRYIYKFQQPKKLLILMLENIKMFETIQKHMK